MPDASSKSRFQRILELLAARGVEFVVIGGQAEVLHGSARVTVDGDVCYRRTPENLSRLAQALKELHPTLRGAPRDLPFILDERTLKNGLNFTFDVQMNEGQFALDILGYVEPLGDYEALLKDVEFYDVDGLKVAVMGLDDLIRVKEHLGRPKDREALPHLRAIKRVREQP